VSGQRHEGAFRGARRKTAEMQHPGGPEIDVVEEWRWREWSRITHSLVKTTPGGARVTHEHRGTVGVYASSRGVPSGKGLSRSERKLRALETLQVCRVEVPAPIDALYFWKPGSHVRVNRGWRDGEFLGWYVDSIRPPTMQRNRIVTMDLVLDALVTPEGTWTWKDRDDFDEALRRELVTEREAAQVWAEAALVQVDLAQRQGAFAAVWDSFVP
jgi:hypothetical protein